MTEASWVPLRTAWEQSLYGERGFYRHNRPADHFRTSPQVAASFAEAVVALARDRNLSSICDIGAGGGELLTQVHRIDPDLRLTGVEVRPPPEDLPQTIGWEREMPTGLTGLVFANELLDNIPCDVVELDFDRWCRLVEVDVLTGDDRLGPVVSGDQWAWLATWWPMTEPGQRAEVGISRDALWAGVCAANPQALCVCVDYGHLAADRPWGGSLSSYRGGVQTAVAYDGWHDITAHVAVDSIAASVTATVRRQRDVLMELGIDGTRPPIERAHADPVGYLRDLSRASDRAELIAAGGLGDFVWVSRSPGDRSACVR